MDPDAEDLAAEMAMLRTLAAGLLSAAARASPDPDAFIDRLVSEALAAVDADRHPGVPRERRRAFVATVQARLLATANGARTE